MLHRQYKLPLYPDRYAAELKKSDSMVDGTMSIQELHMLLVRHFVIGILRFPWHRLPDGRGQLDGVFDGAFLLLPPLFHLSRMQVATNVQSNDH